MSAKIIVANNCNQPKGYIIALVDSSHTLTPSESMQEWIKSGGTPETWKRPFSTVNVTDRTKEELAYLLDPYVIYVTDPPQADGRKYSFSEPAQESEFYQALLTTGEVDAPWSHIEPYLRERT